MVHDLSHTPQPRPCAWGATSVSGERWRGVDIVTMGSRNAQGSTEASVAPGRGTEGGGMGQIAHVRRVKVKVKCSGDLRTPAYP